MEDNNSSVNSIDNLLNDKSISESNNNSSLNDKFKELYEQHKHEQINQLSSTNVVNANRYSASNRPQSRISRSLKSNNLDKNATYNNFCNKIKANKIGRKLLLTNGKQAFNKEDFIRFFYDTCRIEMTDSEYSIIWTRLYYSNVSLNNIYSKEDDIQVNSQLIKLPIDRIMFCLLEFLDDDTSITDDSFLKSNDFITVNTNINNEKNHQFESITNNTDLIKFSLNENVVDSKDSKDSNNTERVEDKKISNMIEIIEYNRDNKLGEPQSKITKNTNTIDFSMKESKDSARKFRLSGNAPNEKSKNDSSMLPEYQIPLSEREQQKISFANNDKIKLFNQMNKEIFDIIVQDKLKDNGKKSMYSTKVIPRNESTFKRLLNNNDVQDNHRGSSNKSLKNNSNIRSNKLINRNTNNFNSAYSVLLPNTLNMNNLNNGNNKVSSNKNNSKNKSFIKITTGSNSFYKKKNTFLESNNKLNKHLTPTNANSLINQAPPNKNHTKKSILILESNNFVRINKKNNSFKSDTNILKSTPLNLQVKNKDKQLNPINNATQGKAIIEENKSGQSSEYKQQIQYENNKENIISDKLFKTNSNDTETIDHIRTNSEDSSSTFMRKKKINKEGNFLPKEMDSNNKIDSISIIDKSNVENNNRKLNDNSNTSIQKGSSVIPKYMSIINHKNIMNKNDSSSNSIEKITFARTSSAINLFRPSVYGKELENEKYRKIVKQQKKFNQDLQATGRKSQGSILEHNKTNSQVFSDSLINIGLFHESLHMKSNEKLPYNLEYYESPVKYNTKVANRMQRFNTKEEKIDKYIKSTNNERDHQLIENTKKKIKMLNTYYNNLGIDKSYSTHHDVLSKKYKVKVVKENVFKWISVKNFLIEFNKIMKTIKLDEIKKQINNVDEINSKYYETKIDGYEKKIKERQEEIKSVLIEILRMKTKLESQNEFLYSKINVDEGLVLRTLKKILTPSTNTKI